MAAVEDAVIVAGGIGSRMLPASAAIAKEMLPLVDIPAVTHLAREAINAGAKRIHIITSPTKDFTSILSDNSWAATKRSDVDEELLSPFNGVEIEVHVQEVPKGFGDALNCALHSIQGHFWVLLETISSDSYSGVSGYKASNASKLPVEEFSKTSLPCVGLAAVEDPKTTE